MAQTQYLQDYQIEDNVPLPDRNFDKSIPEFATISSLEIHKHYTFPLERLKIVESVRNYLKRNTPLRFMYCQLSKSPPLGRVIRVVDNKVFKTFKK